MNWKQDPTFRSDTVNLIMKCTVQCCHLMLYTSYSTVVRMSSFSSVVPWQLTKQQWTDSTDKWKMIKYTLMSHTRHSFFITSSHTAEILTSTVSVYKPPDENSPHKCTSLCPAVLGPFKIKVDPGDHRIKRYLLWLLDFVHNKRNVENWQPHPFEWINLIFCPGAINRSQRK